MSMSTLGSFSFLIRPEKGKDFHLNTYVNTSSEGDVIEFSCRYSPLPGESYDYFISSNYRLRKLAHKEAGVYPYILENSVMLRGTIEDNQAQGVLGQVAGEVSRVTRILNIITESLLQDPKAFEDRLTWHLRSLKKESDDINLSLRDRDLVTVIEVMALSLLGSHHSSIKIIKPSKEILNSVFNRK